MPYEAHTGLFRKALWPMNYVRPGKTRFASLLVLQSPALHCCLCSCVISKVRLEPKRYGAEYLADPPLCPCTSIPFSTMVRIWRYRFSFLGLRFRVLGFFVDRRVRL